MTDKPVSRRHPDWIRVRMPGTPESAGTASILRSFGLATVCEQAHCPNIGDCYRHHAATFMILGSVCTRACRFCAVRHGSAIGAPDSTEPDRLAEAAAQLGLKHVVITSVTRDDLRDGGAAHFVACVEAVKQRIPDACVEVLVPDFGGRHELIHSVAAAPITVFNHNIETVPRLYPLMRSAANYRRSLQVLSSAATLREGLHVKSGIMVGMGEQKDEVSAVMHDVRETGCTILTIGQYLQPGESQLPVTRYIPPDEFAAWRDEGLALGFRHVESGPLVRSSYHAWSHVRGLAPSHSAT